jgi:hypothetical protein
VNVVKIGELRDYREGLESIARALRELRISVIAAAEKYRGEYEPGRGGSWDLVAARLANALCDVDVALLDLDALAGMARAATEVGHGEAR